MLAAFAEDIDKRGISRHHAGRLDTPSVNPLFPAIIIMAWYYSSPSGQTGPVTESELGQLSRAGTINPGTLVWTEGQADWLPLASVRPDLAGGYGASPVAQSTTGGLLVNPASGGSGGSMRQIHDSTGSQGAKRVTGELSGLAEPLYRASGWIKFLGVLTIIQGVFVALSIWGILICWLPIWLGVLLLGAANKIRMSCETNNPEVFHASMEDLGKYFRILGVIAVVSIGIAVLAILAAVAAAVFGLYKFNY